MRVFSFKGRAGRMEYFFHNIIDDFIMIILFAIIITVMTVAESSQISEIVAVVGVICIIVVFILGIFSDIAVTVRRFHDLGQSGSSFWLLLIPLYNIALGFTLLFKKGFEGENEYGADPLVKDQKPLQPDNKDVRQINDQMRSFPEE